MWNLESGSWIVKWSRILSQLDLDFRRKSAIFKKFIETQLKWANNGGHNFKISVFLNSTVFPSVVNQNPSAFNYQHLYQILDIRISYCSFHKSNPDKLHGLRILFNIDISD